jgi:ribonuclease HI
MHEFCLSFLYFALRLNTQMTSPFPIYFRFADGASRHTQNIASAAWVIYHSCELVSSGGICLESVTNNVAEYHVVIELLTEASSLSITQLIINLDSQLAVRQLNREYVVRNSVLLRLHLRTRCIKRWFEFLQYRHILRELNTTSYSLANYMLDWYLMHR